MPALCALAPQVLQRSAHKTDPACEARFPEAALNPFNGAGFQPLFVLLSQSWGFAPGWYGTAPLALKVRDIMGLCAPKAQSISAWGEAPGINGDTE